MQTLKHNCQVLTIQTNIAFLGGNIRRVESSKVQFEKEIFLGQSVQDIASALGAPSKVFYKSEDKMRIHSPNAHRSATDSKSDYFFNYFTLGIVSVYQVYNFLILLSALLKHTRSEYQLHFNILFWLQGRALRRKDTFGEKTRPAHKLPGPLQLQHVPPL